MFRIGLGDDTHRLSPGGPLRLGGVDIPHHAHLVGHSDADVLLHAITDALLGAAALPDIGQIFSDTAPENRGRDSAEMLRLAYAQVVAAGYVLVNLDCVVRAEAPRLSPHKASICTQIAQILEVAPGAIGLKAKTGEGTGSVGEGRVIEATAVALLSSTAAAPG